MSVDAGRSVGLEIGHILFIDIVGYSKLATNEQRRQLEQHQPQQEEGQQDATAEHGKRSPHEGEAACERDQRAQIHDDGAARQALWHRLPDLGGIPKDETEDA